ncbi:MAG TPA: molybdopterin dinucleotide binding domain-containing protein, partial [Chitinolyticbacter sp.]|nr:molybdopterin dinucleotide binding domain-containing protein [Chitinolyticbacter sp.]
LRDQWHGMSRSGRVPQLFAHAPEPSLTMHPQDAERRGFKAGELVRVASKRGDLVLPLAIADDVQSGSVFAAMHWNGQFLNSGGINLASSKAVDAKSFQPELKHAAVRIERVELPWRVLAACRAADVLALRAAVQPLLAQCDYASLSLQGQDTLVLRAACATAQPDWLARLFATLALEPGEHVLDYHDARRGLLKRVAWNPLDNTLAGFAFAGDTAGGDALLGRLLDGEAWQGSRLAAFAPRPAAARDRVICNCKQVKASQIVALVAQGCDVEGLKAQLGCGTVCGSCVPELKRLASQPVAA